MADSARQFDFLVLGSGIAGLTFALKVAHAGSVAIITKKSRAESNTNYAQGGNATQVVVIGHTDSSGSPAYNVRLSERRAKAVADQLVGMGVNQGALQVDWKGESQLAVQIGRAHV